MKNILFFLAKAVPYEKVFLHYNALKNWNQAHQNKKTTINVSLFVFLFWLIQNLLSKDPQTTKLWNYILRVNKTVLYCL